MRILRFALWYFIFTGNMIIILNSKEKIMSEIIRKEICKCENCGNEAEMLVTCSLPDDAQEPAAPAAMAKDKASAAAPKVKGMAVCSHCGNEADMWIDL